MISIIVCSINSDLFKTLSNSIKSTIGLEYEIIKIDNTVEKLSIAQAYNNGASRAKFEILVFVHEDIVFHTVDWGKILISHFKNLENPGVLGIAGSTYLPIAPSDWYLPDKLYIRMNILENRNDTEVGKGIHRKHSNNISEKVYVLDGVFLVILKEVFTQFRFDENLKGFHGYDTSLTLRVSNSFNNYFIPDILIEHFSTGQPKSSWLENTIQAKSSFIKDSTSFSINKELEEKSFHLFLNNLRKFGKDYAFKVKNSYHSFLTINKNFISFKTVFVFLVYQILFIQDVFKAKIYDFKKD
ncbi:glycosyltransferase [Algoriphagus algorifonticola]|uniref:glycosyltransferase n=1 Tax=Algoriphagus algorifonticola TaxID=2593007 RepID=UPI0011A671AE|nr:glycosyltransferase [Algoriphagus algorifonticola]